MARQLILNPGFEGGTLAPWFSIGDGVTTTFSHTGTGAARLTSTAGGTPAEISQFIFSPLTAGALLRLSFSATKNPTGTEKSDITAQVTLFSLFFPFVLPGIIITIPASQNPSGVDSVEFDYYEGYSFPLPPGITSASVLIRNEVPTTGTSELVIDDVFLVEDVL